MPIVQFLVGAGVMIVGSVMMFRGAGVAARSPLAVNRAADRLCMIGCLLLMVGALMVGGSPGE